jgi:ABC-type lipoprotein release transport system permease subunit
MLVFKIAWRNLLRHKGKSFIVGTILFIGALIMTLGNATSIGMQRGIEENVVRSFTGHIIIVSNEETKDNVLFTPMMKPLKILRDYAKVSAVLKNTDAVQDFIPMTRGGVSILGGNQMSFLATFGCNVDDFQRVFKNPISAVEGSLLKNGDHGMLVNANGRKNLFKFEGFWLVPDGTELNTANLTEEAKAEGAALPVKKELALEGFGETNSTNSIIPITGIMRFKALNALMDQLTIMDIESYRLLFGYYTAQDVVEEVPVKQQTLLNSTEDDLFSGGSIYSGGTQAAAVTDLEKKIKTNTKVTRKINYDDAAYNYISVLLKPGSDIGAAMDNLKKAALENNLPIKVLDWKQASGQVAQLSDILQTIILVFVILLFIVATVIIMNTLSMTAIERTEELGMMRAVGARKSFITKMFLAETFALSFIFGGAGIFTGLIVTWIIRPLGISAGGSEIFELLFGGEIFQPVLGAAGVIQGIISLGVVTVLAVILPLVIARKITPLDAINRH